MRHVHGHGACHLTTPTDDSSNNVNMHNMHRTRQNSANPSTSKSIADIKIYSKPCPQATSQGGRRWHAP